TGLTWDNYQGIFGQNGATPAIIGSTLVFAGGSSALGLVLGSLMAWIVERTNAPFGRLVYITAFVSLAIPGIVKVIGWILLLGPEAGVLNVALRSLFRLPGNPFNIFSVGGMTLKEGLLWTPTVFLLMTVPFRTMNPQLEEASTIAGAGTLRTAYHVTLKLARPAVLSILILTVIRSLASFETPALIGVPGHVTVLTTQVYQQVHSGLVPQYGQAASYAMLLTVVVTVLLLPYIKLTAQSHRF